jgi:hypothetical protein
MDKLLETYLLENIDYNPNNGMISRKNKPEKHLGHITNFGYRRICFQIQGKVFSLFAHRLAWFLYYGEWPAEKFEIDHEDRDRLNNCITNLRLATRSQQMRNKSGNKNSKSKYKGVRLVGEPGYTKRGKPKKVWKAYLNVDGESKRLGSFTTELEAALCYDQHADSYGCTTNKQLGLL